jgi:Putative 2OG-Fe(II) oxygenase
MVATPGEPFGQKLVIKPEPGMIVIFPSWMYHFVNPFHGDGERISVAFNVAVA